MSEEWIQRTGEDEVLSGHELAGTHMRNCRFVRCQFRYANLADCVTEHCRFEACDFTGARLNNSMHTDTSFANSLFGTAKLFVAEFHGCQMIGVDLSKTDLCGVTIEGGDWSWAILRGQDLRKQDFRRVKLVEADLMSCNLQKADFRHADLTRAHFEHAQLRGADLRGADLTEVQLQALDLHGVKMDPLQAVQLARSLGVIVSR